MVTFIRGGEPVDEHQNPKPVSVAILHNAATGFISSFFLLFCFVSRARPP